MSDRLYDKDRDIIAQGQHYVRHVEAMTAEDLHSKSDIAAELAHRDIEIERLRARLAEAERERDWYKGLHLDHCAMDCDARPPWKRGADQPSVRPCTCHPDDNPPRPCPQKYALTECREAADKGTAP